MCISLEHHCHCHIFYNNFFMTLSSSMSGWVHSMLAFLPQPSPLPPDKICEQPFWVNKLYIYWHKCSNCQKVLCWVYTSASSLQGLLLDLTIKRLIIIISCCHRDHLVDKSWCSKNKNWETVGWIRRSRVACSQLSAADIIIIVITRNQYYKLEV